MPRKKKPIKANYGDGNLFQRGSRWWFRFRINGKRKAVPTGKSTEAEAIEWRDAKLLELRSPAVAKPKEVTVNEILDDYLEYLRLKGRKSLKIVTGVLTSRIRPVFGERTAASITTKDAASYRAQMPGRDVTANRHLSLLHAAMSHAHKRQSPRKLNMIPHFEMADESHNVRTGFIEDEAYETLLAQMPPSLKPLFTTGYHVSTRKGELLEIIWQMVDLEEGLIEMEPRTAKNKRGRYLPIYGDMVEALASQKTLRDLEYPDADHVFFWHASDVGLAHGGVRVPPGSPIKSFGKSWARAVTGAGYPGLLFHDLRRSAQRNMRKAGIDQSIRMKISGHKTDSMERRYNIVDVNDIKEAAKKLTAWRKGRGW